MTNKKLAVLGSTGSIGRNVLEIVRRHPGRFKILALAAGRNKGLFRRQAEEFKPKIISLSDEKRSLDLCIFGNRGDGRIRDQHPLIR